MFADALSRLPVEGEINYLQLIDPILNFDKNTSDICVLEQTPIEEILQKLQSEQHADEFCKPILEYLQHNALPDEPKQIAQILFHSKYMVVDKGILYHLLPPSENIRRFVKMGLVRKYKAVHKVCYGIIKSKA